MPKFQHDRIPIATEQGSPYIDMIIQRELKLVIYGLSYMIWITILYIFMYLWIGRTYP